ncbi:hypothetical protein [Methylocaldum sp.]|uniref:hypothetical protein n=1 Tax=Methylocaldum sp. TaxID=1969727 RepID=UPI002D4C3DE2|nr:hypothetical protein [Methylocaldum sp.]HYE34295.1 hypothetical protein [Methylocaldum sp.]
MQIKKERGWVVYTICKSQGFTPASILPPVIYDAAKDIDRYENRLLWKLFLDWAADPNYGKSTVGTSGYLLRSFEKYWRSVPGDRFGWVRFPEGHPERLIMTMAEDSKSSTPEVLIADLGADLDANNSDVTLHLNGDGSPIGTDFPRNFGANIMLQRSTKRVQTATEALKNMAPAVAKPQSPADQSLGCAVQAVRSALEKLKAAGSLAEEQAQRQR